MIWYFVESILTLPLLYAIIATIIKFRFGRTKSIIVIACSICLTMAIDGWQCLQGSSVMEIYSNTWLSTMIPAFLTLLYLSKYRNGSFIFIFFTQTVLASVISFMSYLFAYLTPWNYDFIPIIFHTLILAGVFISLRLLTKKGFLDALESRGKKWILYSSLPIVFIIIWTMYKVSPARYMNIEDKISIPYSGYIYPQDIPSFILLLIIIFYTVYLVLVTIVNSHKAETEHREKIALYYQSKAMKERISTLEDKEESLGILRHDMRHHLSTLSMLIQNGETREAGEYLKNLDEKLAITKREFYCTNSVINSIISYYASEMEKAGIDFTVSVSISDVMPVEDMDIGAVLSNILENAKNACNNLHVGERRFTELKFIQHKKQFILDVSNSYDGNVSFDESGHPVSNKNSHGIGTQSILAFARKYNATADFSAIADVFCIRIMFTEM